MKKYRYILIAFTCFLIMLSKNTVFANISDNFKFVIDTIGIPRYNVYGEEINEDIYYTYNTFVYSSPKEVSATTNLQRFKQVENFGKWTQDNGKYSGTGIRGEYNILGRNYSGALVYNVRFPVDSVPETTPDRWVYTDIPGAYESWQDTSKYKYIEQLDYMKNSKLLFDRIDLKTNTCNSYDLIPYNIVANQIGLSKVMLNNCATWKTMGTVTVKRKNNRGDIRDATLAVSPMEASADIRSNLNVMSSYTIDQKQDQIQIPIEFSAQVINLENYANVKHIKNITATLYINDKKQAEVSGSKTVNVDKNILFTVSRNDNPQSNYSIKVKVISYLYTEFNVDGLMQNIVEKTININVEPKKINPIVNISIGNLKKDNINNLVVSPLVQTNITDLSNSSGLIEAGKHIALKVCLDKDIQDQNFYCFLNQKKIDLKLIAKSRTNAVFDILIPMDIEPTLESWTSLRKKYGNYFSVNFDDIGKRKDKPNILKITTDKDLDDDYFSLIEFDSIDNYTENMNYIFNNGVTNKNMLESDTSVEEWLNE